jgi:glycosyltransferase involved in cell wall biosynthesis
LVLLEALASGLPAVAVEATCIPELVKDNLTGYLVPPNDVKTFADRLTHLIENPVLAKEMGQTGRELAMTHSIQSSLDRHERLYKQHIGRRGQAIKPRLTRTWKSDHRFLQP